MQETLTKTLNIKKSEALYKKACELIPGGVNSPVRSFKAVNMNPLFISRAEGAYLWDADNNKFIDFINSWGALINGHSHPKIVKAIQDSVKNGTSYGAPHENEIKLCQMIVNKVPSIEKVRLVNSGTEAVMTAIRLARAYTQRNKIIKFEGCYHGHSDYMLSFSGSGIATLGIPSSPGVTKNIASETITLPYNDLTATEITLNKYPKDIAAIIVEPVVGNCGVIKPKPEFLEGLRTISTKFGVVLIFDEVITGFRISIGGAQEKYNVLPDLTTLGKIIGGGMPIGGIGGKSKIMDMLAPNGHVYQAGTLSGNPISVICGIENLSLLDNNSYIYLEESTRGFCEELIKINESNKIKLQVNYIGSMFSIFFNENNVYNFDSAKRSNTKKYAEFFKRMLYNGIYFAPSQFEANFISTAHKKEDLEKTLSTYNKVIKEIA